MKTTTEYKVIKIEDFPDPSSSILKQIQPEVQFPLSDEDIALINFLKQKCLEFDGIGLAAPQVGGARHIAVIFIPENASLLRENVTPHPLHVIINGNYDPIAEDGMSEDFESCYSVGFLSAKVKRHNSIKLKYQNEQGEVIEKIEHGFYARAFQHEIDHCNGILFPDRLDENSLKGSPREMLKIRRQELSPEKQLLFDLILKKKGIEL
jgi:peptide deformylase